MRYRARRVESEARGGASDVEQARGEDEERREAVLEALGAMPAAVVVADPQAHLVYLNHQAEELLRCRLADTFGQNVHELIARHVTNRGVLDEMAVKIAQGRSWQGAVMFADGDD